MTSEPQSCRLCGTKQGILSSIFGTRECIAQIEAVVPDVIILKNDSLPKVICHRCTSKVNEFFEFRVTCIRTQENFKKSLPWMNAENADTMISKKCISPMVTYIGGPLAYPFGSKEPEVEVYTLSDDEDEGKIGFSPQPVKANDLAQLRPKAARKIETCSPKTVDSNLSSQSDNSSTLKGNSFCNPQPSIHASSIVNYNSFHNSQSFSDGGKSKTCSKSLREANRSLPSTTELCLHQKRRKPKPKCKKRPHELEITDKDLSRNSTYPAVSVVTMLDGKVVYTCCQCDAILMSPDAIPSHRCVQPAVPESQACASTKEDSKKSTSSNIELIISDDESTDQSVAPMHYCDVCGKAFYNLGRLQKHQQSLCI